MHWNSFDEFIHMGGYGLYVWGSYGLTLPCSTSPPSRKVRLVGASLAATCDGE